MSPAPGVFITFEGGEGTGKSTQIARLCTTLQRAGVEVVRTREPGGTPIGEAIRAILLDPANTDLAARAELLLYEAARAQLVASVIEPALRRGAVVVADRFADSSTAYQGYARGLGADEVRSLNAAATGGLEPDVTLVLDLEPAVGLARATGGGTDRLEAEALDFHEAVRAGFLAIARDEPGRVRLVDADGTPDQVELRILAALRGVPRLEQLMRQGSGR